MPLSLTGMVRLPASVSAACEAEARHRYPYETGGAFMGRRGPRGEYRVEAMIGPGAGADHRRSSFRPDAEWQWSEMRRIHAARPGIAFLGDWHTHPGAVIARLSGMDRRALAEILSSDETRADTVLSVILSGGPTRWGWRVWEARGERGARGWPSLVIRRLDLGPA